MNSIKKVYYWSPFLSKIATIDAVINSALGLSRYSKLFNSTIINSIGEFDEAKKICEKNRIIVKNLIDFDLIKFLPSNGYIFSRLSFLVIFFVSFFKLKNLLKKDKPEFLIVHLITSLPLILNYIYNFETKIIFRISGYPRLNILRKFFWKITFKKVFRITCPTQKTKELLVKEKIADEKKIFVLKDPIISVKKINFNKKIKFDNNYGKFILGAGRLTKQKNFSLLIETFSELSKKIKNLNLVIAGDGEEKSKLQRLILQYKLEKKIFLVGYQENLFNFFKNCECFVLTSLWEDPGFVVIESAFCRTNIISSNCPNGPKEFFDDGKYGNTYNNKAELLNLILKVLSVNTKEENNYNKKILQMKTRGYTIFNHFVNLNNLLIS